MVKRQDPSCYDGSSNAYAIAREKACVKLNSSVDQKGLRSRLKRPPGALTRKIPTFPQQCTERGPSFPIPAVRLDRMAVVQRHHPRMLHAGLAALVSRREVVRAIHKVSLPNKSCGVSVFTVTSRAGSEKGIRGAAPHLADFLPVMLGVNPSRCQQIRIEKSVI